MLAIRESGSAAEGIFWNWIIARSEFPLRDPAHRTPQRNDASEPNPEDVRFHLALLLCNIEEDGSLQCSSNERRW
jgi:hypothetical protein